MIKALIFDLDGVIVDTAHYHYVAWKRLAAELGIDLTPAHNELLKGVSRIRSLEIILGIGDQKLPAEEIEILANKKNSWFVESINQMKPDEIFPGVREMLAQARNSGFKIALASSSKNAPTVLRLLEIENAFDTVVDGSMIEKAKPDPEIFLMAAERLGVKPAECVVFEDAEAGVEGAVAAGMKCVGVGNPVQLNKANVVVKQTADFKLQEINSIF